MNRETTAELERMDVATAARIMREAVRDKSYQLSPLGMEVARYLRALRKRGAKNTQDAYESTLDKFCRAHLDLELRDFEPPVGTERLEEWLDAEWGHCKPATYNRHLSTMREFFKFQVERQQMVASPMQVIRAAKKRETLRETFDADQRRAIIASQENVRDRIALRLLLHYGLRRGSLQAIQFKHFDHVRKRLYVFLKGGKVRSLPIPQPAFWHDLERHIIDVGGESNHYLMAASRKNRYGVKFLPEQPMSGNGLHKWWYRCLANAGIVPEGANRGEKMHKARHTAGQTVLDKTGNLKAVQRLLGHESMQTTADTYVDWDEDRLAGSLIDALQDEDAE